MRVLTAPETRDERAVERITLADATDDRLYFAQVREDPLLEIEALDPRPDDSFVVVGSGGCTALSLLSAGAGHVAAVDINRAQNHLIELKLAAAALPWAAMLGTLGARHWRGEDRLDAYRDCRFMLSPDARAYWDARPSEIANGVLNAGVTERFIRAVVFALEKLVHPRARIDRMLASASIDEQAARFHGEWNTMRWRGFFHLLLNRIVFRRAYDPAFFSHLERPSFAAHFRARAEHTLTRLGVQENYFLHHMLTNEYSIDHLPPYLSEPGSCAIAENRDALTLVDGSVTNYLRTLPDSSVSGFALSNICEWLTPAAVDELFAEVVRTARPNAHLCFRNFVGWTEVPYRWRDAVVEDRALGEAMIARDRAVVQRRIAICRVDPRSSMTKGQKLSRTTKRAQISVREAKEDDNASLLDLALACPMDGDIALAISREPDFFALNRLEGSDWRLGVAEVEGRVAGCVMAAARNTYLHSCAQRTLYAGDLKVHPMLRGRGIADALTEWARGALTEVGGPDMPTLITVLAGNRAMERRTSRPDAALGYSRFATIRAFSIPLLWARSADTRIGLTVDPAEMRDLDEMTALWQRVAISRQFAPAFDAAELQRWIASAPGLSIDDYRVARGRDGRIVGFVAWWDQSTFKQSRVLRYSRRLGVVRAAINGIAAISRGVRLPNVGEPMRYRTALHVCVPSGRPEVLRALVRSSCDELRAERYAFATMGLDVRDRLCAAMNGLGAQPTDVNAYVFTPNGPYSGPSLTDRPLHYEIALV